MNGSLILFILQAGDLAIDEYHSGQVSPVFENTMNLLLKSLKDAKQQ